MTYVLVMLVWLTHMPPTIIGQVFDNRFDCEVKWAQVANIAARNPKVVGFVFLDTPCRGIHEAKQL